MVACVKNLIHRLFSRRKVAPFFFESMAVAAKERKTALACLLAKAKQAAWWPYDPLAAPAERARICHGQPQSYVHLRRDLRANRNQRFKRPAPYATGKYSRRIEKMLVNCTSSGVLTRIESDPSVVQLSRCRTPMSALGQKQTSKALFDASSAADKLSCAAKFGGANK
jgi:hypothetical protein